MSQTKQTKMAPKVLIECASTQFQLLESKSGGRMRVRGEFARADIATENRRIYPRKLWEKQIKRLDKSLKERKVLGELDHPTDGSTKLSRVSHLVTDLVIEADGRVIGEAEILDTEPGKALKALLNAGCKIGVSSRGHGSTVENESGDSVVQEDYTFRTFDFVAEPADTSAYPEIVSESVQLTSNGTALFEGLDVAELEKEQELAAKFAATIQATRKEEQENARSTLREEFTSHLLGVVAAAKSEMREQIRGELLSDPSVAQAKSAIDRIKEILMPLILPEDAEGVIKQRDAEIIRLKRDKAETDLRVQALESENVKIAHHARSLGYQLHVERSFAGPNAETARKLIGEVTTYKTAADLKTRVSTVVEELAKTTAQVANEQTALTEAQKAELAAKDTQLNELNSKLEKLANALEKSMLANNILQEQVSTLQEQVEAVEAEREADRKEYELRLYAQEQLVNNPSASRIKAQLSASRVASKKDIDAIVESSTRTRAPDADEAESVRSRVRSLTRGGFQSRPLDEEAPAPRRGPNRNNEIGVDLGEFKVLAGVSKRT